MDGCFVQIINSEKLSRIVNIRQIVQVVQQGTDWQVILTVGQPFTLNASEAKPLLKCLAVEPVDETSAAAATHMGF